LVSVSGGCLPYRYLWSNGDTLANASGLFAGNHSVLVTDGGGETTIANITITAPALLQAMIQGDTIVCGGDSSGTLVAVVTGGHTCATYNYAWSNGVNVSAISGLPAGNYGLNVTDSLGCLASAATTLQLGTSPLFTLGQDTSKCPGIPLIFTATSGFANYLWNNGSNNATISMGLPGSYHCTVWNAQGCHSSDTLTVTNFVVDNTIITANGGLTLCEGDTLALIGDNGLSNYQWSTGATTQSILVTGFGGVIGLTATDMHGCEAQDQITLTYRSFGGPNPVIQPSPIAYLCDGGSLQLSAGVGYFSYAWSNGGTASTTTVTQPGTYHVTVWNGFGCTASSAPVTVVQLAALTPTVIASSGNLSTGVPYQGYQWFHGGNLMPGAITSILTPSAVGWYSVAVTDSNGCSGTSAPVYFNPVAIEEEIAHFNGLMLFPNPTNGVLNLRTQSPIDWPIQVEVWDLFGRKLRSFDMAHLMDVAVFDLSDLSAATYLLKVTSFQHRQAQQTVMKFVKE
jgi:hypothetical protein